MALTAKEREGLNTRQMQWVLAFVDPTSEGFGNATASARLSGYSAVSAEKQGLRMSSNVRVRALIDRLQSKAAAAASLSLEKYLSMCELTAMEWVDDDGTPRQTPIVAEVGRGKKATTRVVGYQRERPVQANVKALELLGEVSGHVKPRVPVGGNGGNTGAIVQILVGGGRMGFEQGIEVRHVSAGGAK